MKITSTNDATGLLRFLPLAVIVFFLLPSSSFSQPYNEPCNAFLYDFGGGNNVVPCGPSANTTPQVAINGQGATMFPLAGAPCGTPGNGGSPTDALWVTFVIQEGGSFEWQTVPGKDDFYWQLYYSTDPVDMPGEETTQSGCGTLALSECGQEFTGWKISSTPDPSKKWRFYLVFYLRNGDQVGTGVVKIRKSCGEGCASSTIAVAASEDVCINSGSSTLLSATASGGGGGPYSYTWTPDATLDDPFIQSPTASPLTTTIYTVTAVGADRCPASDQVTVEVGTCCDAAAGMISNNAASLDIPCNKKELKDGANNNAVFTTNNSHNTDLVYALILANMNGEILEYQLGSAASFTFFDLAPGMYFVYGLSYDNVKNAPTTLEQYLTALQANAPGTDDINEILNSTLCLDLVSGGANNKVTIGTMNCGNFN